MPKSPEPHLELDPTGRKLYHRIKGWISTNAEWVDSDQVLLNQACLYEQRSRDARKAFNAGDRYTAGGKYTVIGSTGSPVVNPMIRVAETAEKAFVDCLKELGLTPRARAALNLEPKPSGNDPLADAFG